MNLIRIKHDPVRGATTYEGLYTFSDTTITPKFTSLKRQLGDFIDYGIPPSTIATPERFVKYTSLMPVSQLGSLVQYPTHFSINGFGYKTLTSTELAKYFVISTIVYQMEFHKDMFPIVPIQILDTLPLELLHSPVSIGTI